MGHQNRKYIRKMIKRNLGREQGESDHLKREDLLPRIVTAEVCE
jgi:hypothetical protein